MADRDVQIKISLQDELSRGLSTIEGNVNNLSNAGKGVTSNMMKFGTILGGATIAGLTFGTKVGSELEMLRASMTTLTGSTEKGAEMFQFLNTFAKKTPFAVAELASASQTMLAFGISADKTKEYLRMLGDVSMGNKERLAGLSLAFSQVQSTGRLMGQDLLQMINQGFNPLQIISEQTGKSMAVLKTEMENGAISADMVSEAFQIATSEGGLFYGGMDRGAQTLNGRLSTLWDTFNLTIASSLGLSDTGEVVKGSFFDKLTNAVIQLTSWIEANQEQIKLFIQNGLNIMIQVGTTVISTVQKMSEFYLKHKGVIDTLLITIGVLVATFATVSVIVGIVAGAIAVLTSPFLGLGLAIGGVISVGVAVIRNWDEIKKKAGEVGNAVKGVIDKIGQLSSAPINAVKNLLPKFATGGIIGGNSYAGDNVLTRVNSGEMILNKQQQARLFSMANNGGSGSGGNTININIQGGTWSEMQERQRIVGVLKQELRLNGIM